ncbi:pyridoxal phosphate-dependent class II aminotransferase [Dysgonomonas sp. 216]|uniref:threonine-phosphate decarboxylase n=1 Tax=Dysgonomonas sp. 216 TaxID=2302934 RepID=UPI0013D11EB3|nr:threonine-phosphate decarboxylase [Dysgonomonas sp. 216]NDW17811.1 pyridoxal phosphate-dependent class II aminotransferase [Dysgonomonas sp. 216]
MLNGHGDDIYGLEAEIVSNFSSNVYAQFDLSGLQQHLCTHIKNIRSYPEPEADSLAKLLAKHHNISANNICVTNGATEAIYLIAQVFKGKKSTIITPTFSEYEDACQINGHKLSFVASLSQVNKDTELIWLCNPNNPSGSVYHKQYLDKYITKHPDIYFIIDQSYESFTDKQYTFSATEGLKHKNVILLHSMTKSYAIPGLRLGYITAFYALTESISKIRMPWSVNQLAIEAGKYLLKEEKTGFDLKAYLTETNRLMTELSNLDGLIVLPTNTHFFLCELINRKASELKKYLIKKHGILIRDAANFRGLDDSFFRIATQSKEENNLLIKAIEQWMQLS